MDLAGVDQDFLLRSNSLAVSVYLALDPDQRDLRLPEGQAAVALQEVEKALKRRGLPGPDCDALLDRIRAALQRVDWRKRRDPGLAILLADEETRIVPLPRSVGNTVVVGRHFFIRPLLRLLGPEFFHILTVSAQGARLLECDRYQCRDRTPASFKHNLEQEIAITEVEKDFQISPVARPRSGAPGGVVPGHSYESPAELQKVLLTNHLRRLATAAETALRNDNRPVVLVADPENGGHFRKLTRLPQLLAEGLTVNPDALKDDELMARARAVVIAPYDTSLAKVLDHVNARLGTAKPNVAIRLEEIVTAAHEGRVDAVVVATDETVWGHFDDGSRTVRAHGTPDADDEELLNDIVVETLAKGGRAYALSRDKLPRQALAVATLRY